MRAHTDTDNGDLGDVFITLDAAGTHFLGRLLDDFDRLFIVSLGDRKSQVRVAVAGDILNDHVHRDIGVGERREDP